MKQIIAILISLALLGQMFQGDFIMMDYYTHTQKYAAHCINKEKPAMHCNGKCQMYVQMEKAHQEKKSHPEHNNTFKIVLYSPERFLHSITIPFPTEKLLIYTKDARLTERNLFAVFHPPRFLV